MYRVSRVLIREFRIAPPKRVSAAVFAGAAVGAAVLCAMIAFGAILWLRRRRRLRVPEVALEQGSLDLSVDNRLPTSGAWNSQVCSEHVDHASQRSLVERLTFPANVARQRCLWRHLPNQT
jgi:hypothetical protein